MTNQLILAPAIAHNPETAVIDASGARAKVELLAKADAITSITTPHIRDAAVDVAAEIKTHLTDVEEARKIVKAPFWAMCCAIDAAAKKHTFELEHKLKILNQGVGIFNEEQRQIEFKKAEEHLKEHLRIEEARIAEENRIRLEAERLQREQEALLEKQRQAHEAALAKGRELTPAAKAKALQAQLDAQEAQEKLAQEAADRQREFERKQQELQQQRIAEAEQARQHAAKGGAQTFDLDITVTDIRALLAAHPSCVKLSPDLVAIKWLINNQPDKLPLPGVSFTRTPVFHTRKK